MPFGILEYHGPLEHVPGTVELQDTEMNQHVNLKKSAKEGNIVLVPQPTNDPNDPLNWPLWQRDMLTFFSTPSLLCSALEATSVGPILSVLTLQLVAEFYRSFTQFVLLLGCQLYAVGATGIFISATSRRFGKRPNFIVSVSLAFAGCLWAGASQSYGSLVGARVVQGLGIAIFESVTFVIIGDLYFIHQRVAGPIAQNLGWRWVFWLFCIFMGIAWVLIILFGWETAYRQADIYNLDSSVHNVGLKSTAPIQITCSSIGRKNTVLLDEAKSEVTASHLESTAVDARGTVADPPPQQQSIWQRMAFYHRIAWADESFVKLILRPIIVLLNPAIIWAVVLNAFCQNFIVGFSYILAPIFGVPPYNFDTAQIGYLYAGPIICGFLGCSICGLVSDPLAKWSSRKNNGIYEPEFRLILTIWIPITTTIDYFGFGHLVAEGTSSVVMSIVFGISFMSVQFAANKSGAYLVDGFRNLSVEAFVIAMAVKNFIFFGFSFFFNNWIAAWGPTRTFNCISGITLGIAVTTIPVYVFGKRMRG